MPKPVELLEKICAAPGTDEPLTFAAGGCSAPDGTHFRSIRGVPILRREDPPVRERPTDAPSGGLPPDLVAHLDALPGYTLLLGAGNSNFRHPRVVEVEFDLFRDTDVVGDAHALPLRSDGFDMVLAMNVFEHLRRPFDAARELMRVLKPGGEVLIHTAFLQPLHEAPAHFFNATEFGVREWFGDFEDVEIAVSGNFNPLYSLAWIASEVLAGAEHHLGREAAERLGRLSLAQTAEFWRNPERWNPEAEKVFRTLPDAVQRSTAAGFELRARKPN